jgi:hypothetical protein
VSLQEVLPHDLHACAAWYIIHQAGSVAVLSCKRGKRDIILKGGQNFDRIKYLRRKEFLT